MPCALCGADVAHFADGEVLLSRPVEYVRCVRCGSVLLQEPDWFDEAYSDAITALDVGLLERCLQLANITEAVLRSERLSQGTFLDFAGGYGTLTRLMRDRGRDFHHLDPYAVNVHAPGHEGSLDRRYDVVTAFEVLEHLADPVETLEPVAATTDLLLVTTQVLPDPAPPPGGWEYYSEETGQHITFYTVEGLRSVAERLGMQLTTSGWLVHMLHRRPLRPSTRLLLRDERLAYAVGALRSEFARRRGLTAADRASAARRLRGTTP